MTDVPLIITPDPDDPGCADIAVDGTVGGRPYRFALDTGAATTQVIADERTAAAAVVREIDTSGTFAGTRAAVVELPDVTVGPLKRSPVDAVRVDPESPGAHNLLGMNVLRHYRCLFLFDDARLVVDTAEPAPHTLWMDELWMDAAGHPYVDVRLPDITAAAVWDTGAGITVVDSGFVERHRRHFEPSTPSTGTDSTGASVETPTYWMAEVTIGGVRFAAHRVAAVDLTGPNATLVRPMDMILGYPALTQAHWYFDFPGKRWGVGRPPAE